MSYLLTTTETYRFESENEVTEFLDSVKENQKNYILSKDEWYRVTIVKEFNKEKEPDQIVNVNYVFGAEGAAADE